MYRMVIILVSVLFCNTCFSQLNKLDDSCKMIPRLIPVKIRNCWGYCDQNLKIIIKPQFEKAEPFCNINYPDSISSKNGNYATVQYKGIYYRIDTIGKFIDKIDYAKLKEDEMVFAGDNPHFEIFSESGKYGVRSLSPYKVIVNPIYEEVQSYDPNLVLYFPYLLKSGGKYGIARQDGKIIVPVIYDEIRMFGLYWNGIRLLYAVRNKKEFYIDYCGKEYTWK